MAQSESVSWADVDISLSENNYVLEIAIEGAANSLVLSGGERTSGEEYTADGDLPLLYFGKRTPVDVTVRVVFEEVGDKASTLPVQTYEAEGGGPLDIRWYPEGIEDTNWMYSTANGKVVSPSYPHGDLVAPGPIMTEFTIRAQYVVKAVYSA